MTLDWRSIATALLIAFIVFAGGRAVGVWDMLWESSSNAVSQSEFNNLKDTVNGQGNKIDRMIDQLDRLAGDIGQLNASVKEMNSTVQDFRLVRQTVDGVVSDTSDLQQRQRYLWDSVNRLCERQDMICATRNALFNFPRAPTPKHRMFVDVYALHKSPAEGLSSLIE